MGRAPDPARRDLRAVGQRCRTARAARRTGRILVDSRCRRPTRCDAAGVHGQDRQNAIAGRIRTGVRSEEHTSELQSLMRISYAVFCLKKKKKKHRTTTEY